MVHHTNKEGIAMYNWTKQDVVALKTAQDVLLRALRYNHSPDMEYAAIEALRSVSELLHDVVPIVVRQDEQVWGY
jgi:hypothetical protein